MLEEIYNYLYERAEKKWWDWAKMLINFIIEEKKELNDNKIKEVFDFYLIEKWIEQWNNKKIDPIFSNIQREGNIKIKKISDIKWVNKLIWDQELEFSDNLTVIYWENASWKTWYSRILKSLWKSYDKENIILWNVLEKKWKEKQYCKIFIQDIKGKDKEIEWTWVWSVYLPISLFNSSCVNIWIDKNRDLTFMPFWFSLFEIVKIELLKLLELINGKKDLLKNSIENKIVFKDSLKSNKYKDTVSSINSKTNKKFIDDIVKDSDKELLEKKQRIEKNIKSLNKENIESKNARIEEMLSELGELKLKINKYKAVFSEDNRKNFISLNIKLEELKKSPRMTISDIAKKNWMEYYESEEFENFIKAADLYLKKLSKSNFKKWDVCPYCKQKLSESATQLLESYKGILNSEIQKEINVIQLKLDSIKGNINNLDDLISFHYFPFWKDDDWKSIIPEEIKNIFNLKREYVDNVTDEKFINDKTFDNCISIINSKELELNDELRKNRKLLSSIDENEKKLKESLYEVEDKIIINTKKKILEEYVNELILYEKLQDCSQDFRLNDLSTVLKKAQKELLTASFDNIYLEEKDLLNCPDYINLKLKVSEWKTAINQSIEDYDLKNILSEWEQKSIAIAEFITELRISNDNNPVIFDDLVNSLDHHRLERVARRLFKLSLERQVIVFTHNIILFYTFEQIKDEYKLMNKKIDSIIYSVEKQGNKCWKLNKDKWPSNTTFESYVSKTEKLIKKSINTNESEIVEKWYWYLRAMIELLIEDWIFKKTVKRYKKNVSTTNLLRVRWDLLDWNKEKIIEIFCRCSWYMWWHSWPEEINNTPNLSELKADFQNIKSIWNDFNKKE